MLNGCIISKQGQDWYVDGIHHREDGPAIIDTDGTEYWIRHNNFHRVDGPAFCDPRGHREFYLNGVNYKIDDWLELLDISPAEKVLLKMQWG